MRTIDKFKLPVGLVKTGQTTMLTAINPKIKKIKNNGLEIWWNHFPFIIFVPTFELLRDYYKFVSRYNWVLQIVILVKTHIISYIFW